MFKKSFMAMMALFLVLFTAGCGGGKDDSKSAADKPEYSADKAVLGYAEMYAFGATDHLKETGLTESDVKAVKEKIIGDLIQSFSQFPLSDDNVVEMIGVYAGKLFTEMDIKATLKKDDPENPVVTLSVCTLNNEGATKEATTNEDIIALGTALGQLQAEGITVDQLKENADFQKAVMECISNFIDKLPFNAETSMDVPCVKLKGSDGKIYWAPKDPAAVAQFVQPQ